MRKPNPTPRPTPPPPQPDITIIKKGKPMSKTVTINGLEFEVHEEAKFLSLANSVPKQVGDIVTCNVYDLRIDPPKFIIKSDMIADVEYIAMMEEIQAGDKYYSVLQTKE